MIATVLLGGGVKYQLGGRVPLGPFCHTSPPPLTTLLFLSGFSSSSFLSFSCKFFVYFPVVTHSVFIHTTESVLYAYQIFSLVSVVQIGKISSVFINFLVL